LGFEAHVPRFGGRLVGGFVKTRESDHKCHRKVTRHMQTTFSGLAARRRLCSSEGAPEGVREVCWAKSRSRRRYQTQERSIPGSVRISAWRESWLGLTKHNSRKYIATREISLKCELSPAAFTMCYADAHTGGRQPTCTELYRGPWVTGGV